MALIKLFHPYKCRHCNTVYIILPGKFAWSFLPVELNAEQLKTPSLWEGEWGWAFDKDKHVSHLLNCKALQAQWETVKNNILHQLTKQENLYVKELLK